MNFLEFLRCQPNLYPSWKRGRFLAHHLPCCGALEGTSFIFQKGKVLFKWSILYSWFDSFPSRPLSPSNILLIFLIYFSSSPSSVFLETAYKQRSGNRLFIYHIHYYRCPHPQVNLRVRIQALTEKKDLNSSLLKCSGLVGFFLSQKKQVITLLTALIIIRSECLVIFTSL